MLHGIIQNPGLERTKSGIITQADRAHPGNGLSLQGSVRSPGDNASPIRIREAEEPGRARIK